jgi:hypothetical protein
MWRTGFVWLRIGSSGGLLWTRWWTFGFHKKAGCYLAIWVTIGFSKNILHHGLSKVPLCSTYGFTWCLGAAVTTPYYKKIRFVCHWGPWVGRDPVGSHFLSAVRHKLWLCKPRGRWVKVRETVQPSVCPSGSRVYRQIAPCPWHGWRRQRNILVRIWNAVSLGTRSWNLNYNESFRGTKSSLKTSHVVKNYLLLWFIIMFTEIRH